MNGLRKVAAIAETAWNSYICYRVNFIVEVVASLFTMMITVFLWKTIFSESGDGKIGGYDFHEMLTYLVGAWILFNVSDISMGDRPDASIRSGELSNLLVKPISPLTVWFLEDLFRKIVFFIVAVQGFLILLLVFRNFLIPPPAVSCLVISLLVAGFGTILHFLMFNSLSLLCFWMDTTWGLRFSVKVIFEIASGSIIPLTLFKGIAASALKLLPFQFFAFVPMQIYLGRMTLNETGNVIILEIFWIIFFGVIGLVIWNKGIKKYQAFGQ
jgi:ABC-2 type transport system permease protein